MRIKGGYNKKILEIDVGKEKVKISEISDEFALKYVGGRGWGAKIVWDSLLEIIKKNKIQADRFIFRNEAFSPDNIFVIATGPLTGLYFPGAGKTSFSSISPETGIYADSNFGGMFGVELKQAGYDAMVLKGAASSLKYVFINDNETEIKDASAYRNKGCIETERLIKEEIGDEEVRVACIGPAGENLVRFACVNTEWGRNAGRTGMGAILGSKNIKAIAVRGSKDIPVSNLESLIEISDRGYDYLRKHFLFDLWQRQGLMSVVDYLNTMGAMPSYNYREGFFEGASGINGENMERKYKIGDTACFGCSMCCGNVCLIKEGKHAGTVIEGPEYQTTCMFGPNLGIDDFSYVIRANYLCDELGMDTISTGNLIGALIEGLECGIIKKEEVGFPIKWGDGDKVLLLIKKIAKREGVGNILAEGSYGIIERWGEMERIIAQVKFLEQSAYDAHVSICMALAYGTCDIGAHHNRAWPIAKELEAGRGWDMEKKVDLVIYHQRIRPLFDMLGVCRLPWIELGLPEDIYAGAYSAATGIETSIKDLMLRSNAVYNLTRAIGVKLGIRRKDDYPPERVFEQALKGGPSTGSKIDRDEYERMLSLYYKKRGWNEKGIPKKEKLCELGLGYVAEETRGEK